VVLHLALRHAARMRALIGLQSGLHAGADDNSQQTLDHLHHPNIHGGEAATVAVAGLMAPQSPDAHRWETLWHYASGGPGVFRGDLYYYFVDGDLRNQDLRVDTNECPLFLLSGEYDYSAPPSAGREVAARIKGSKFTEMAGLGHFPMSENPDQFKQYLLPVLDEIRAAG
jgi:pimeloyl-ACP methyl ester carboxylesterase